MSRPIRAVRFRRRPSAQRPAVWLPVAVLLPFLFVAIFSNWDVFFRSGDASLYTCGALLATFGENLAEQQLDRFRRLWWAWPKLWLRWLWEGIHEGGYDYGERFLEDDGADALGGCMYYVFGVVAFAANLVVVIVQRHASDPQMAWWQVVAVTFAALALPAVRWAFTALQPD